MIACSERIRQTLPIKDFAAFGVDLVAYVKPVAINGTASYAVHAADGTPLTMLPDRSAAFDAVRRHDMAPVSVH